MNTQAIPVTESRGLRERIIQTATELFADQGYAGTTVRQLVTASGCTKPALYYYFDNKETLFRHVVQLHMDTTSEMIREALDSPGTFRARIHRSVKAFVDYARSDPNIMRLLQRIETRLEDSAPDVNIMATRELHLQMLSRLIEQGIAAEELRADIASMDCALVLAGTLSFQFEMALATGVWDEDRLYRTVDLILDGIRA